MSLIAPAHWVFDAPLVFSEDEIKQLQVFAGLLALPPVGRDRRYVAQALPRTLPMIPHRAQRLTPRPLDD